ncbi:hypothetical protein F8B43_1427 [Methylorubrum populi]|uniref:Uncharacterized protein n=1 Tax=Methylorubrum populi TaxID=223967 RepID=A0A833J9U5_9HYPH|nr:hypothetical protein F8B43_1427 [Methylorubrum populi]
MAASSLSLHSLSPAGARVASAAFCASRKEPRL